MFKLYVALFLITNGVPAQEPSGIVPNNTVFQTREECDNFFETDAGKKAHMALEYMVNRGDKKFMMKSICAEIVKGESI